MSSTALSSTFTKKTENFSFQGICTLKSTLESWSWRVSQQCHWLFLPHTLPPLSLHRDQQSCPCPLLEVLPMLRPLGFWASTSKELVMKVLPKYLCFSSASPVNIIPSITNIGSSDRLPASRTRKTWGPGARRSESQVSPLFSSFLTARLYPRPRACTTLLPGPPALCLLVSDAQGEKKAISTQLKCLLWNIAVD